MREHQRIIFVASPQSSPQAQSLPLAFEPPFGMARPPSDNFGEVTYYRTRHGASQKKKTLKKILRTRRAASHSKRDTCLPRRPL